MTPKEAILQLERIAPQMELSALDRYYYAIDALKHYTIPRTGPPTVEEVGNKQQCLVRVSGTKDEWCNYCGEDIRTYWRVSFDAWLPLPEVQP